MKADLDGFSPAARGGSLSFGGVVFSKEESTLLARHLGALQTHRANARLIGEGQPLDRPRLIRSGWACRVRYMANGRRQILNYYLPGDLMGLSVGRDDAALATYVSLTRVTTMDFGALRELALSRPLEMPGLGAAFRNTRILEEHYLLSQIARIGQQKAYERVAHLLLEFHMRLTRAGLANGNTFQLPLTQEILGDGLGLSAVHINRTFKLLKRKNYVRMDRSFVTLLDPAALAEIAGYREPIIERTTDAGTEAGASVAVRRPELTLPRSAPAQRVPDQLAGSIYRSPTGTWMEAER